jgi:hypothetical protein
MRASSPPAHTDLRPGSTAADGAVISFLSDVLTGDSTWTMGEVQRVVVVRDLAKLGRWRASGLDDEETTG